MVPCHTTRCYFPFACGIVTNWSRNKSVDVLTSRHDLSCILVTDNVVGIGRYLIKITTCLISCLDIVVNAYWIREWWTAACGFPWLEESGHPQLLHQERESFGTRPRYELQRLPILEASKQHRPCFDWKLRLLRDWRDVESNNLNARREAAVVAHDNLRWSPQKNWRPIGETQLPKQRHWPLVQPACREAPAPHESRHPMRSAQGRLDRQLTKI